MAEETPSNATDIAAVTDTPHTPADSTSTNVADATTETPVQEAPADSTGTVNTKVTETFNNSKAKQETAAEKPAAKNTNKSSGKKTSPKIHTVRKGESLYKIAKKHGTTVKELQRINGIDGSKLKPGDKIKLK